MSPKALVLLHEGFEELEAVAPIDLMSRAGIEVTLASIEDSDQVTGRTAICIKADARLQDLDAETLFDVVVLPGGPGIGGIRKHGPICQLLSRHQKHDKHIACICAAPLLLKDSGLLTETTRYTAFPATAEELPNAIDTDVVTEGKLITSRGAGTSIEFALAIIEALIDSEKAAEIAKSICWQHY